LKENKERCPKSFSLPASILDKSKACFRRSQNSPAVQTVVIADLALRQDLLTKMIAMAVQMDILWATEHPLSYVIPLRALARL
jgi:hypothetical protein